MEQPNLCHAYYQADKQSLDKPATPPLAPYVAIGYGLPISLDRLSFERFLGAPTSCFPHACDGTAYSHSQLLLPHLILRFD